MWQEWLLCSRYEPASCCYSSQSYRIIIIIIPYHLCTGTYNIHLKQTMFLGYTVLQIFCSYNLRYTYMYITSHNKRPVLYISTSPIICAVPIVTVLCSSSISCSSCICSGIYEWLWNDSSCPNVTGITFVSTFHMCYISIVRSLYFRIFSTSFLITFLSADFATYISMHVQFYHHALRCPAYC